MSKTQTLFYSKSSEGFTEADLRYLETVFCNIKYSMSRTGFTQKISLDFHFIFLLEITLFMDRPI